MDGVFKPLGKTIKVAGAGTAPTGIAAPTENAGSGAEQYRAHNAGLVTAHIAVGQTAALAQTNAVIPTGGGANSKNSFPLPAGAVEVFTLPPDSFFSAITPSSTADIFITPGRGN